MKVETPIRTRVNISTDRSVAVVAEDDRADRPGDVGEGEGRERHHQRRGVGVGEEHVREDQGRGSTEQEEVVVLDGAAHEAGQGGLPGHLDDSLWSTSTLLWKRAVKGAGRVMGGRALVRFAAEQVGEGGEHAIDVGTDPRCRRPGGPPCDRPAERPAAHPSGGLQELGVQRPVDDVGDPQPGVQQVRSMGRPGWSAIPVGVQWTSPLLRRTAPAACRSRRRRPGPRGSGQRPGQRLAGRRPRRPRSGARCRRRAGRPRPRRRHPRPPDHLGHRRAR